MLAKLKTLSKYQIAQSTDDQYFKRGEHYFKNEALTRFVWKNNDSVLECYVEGSKIYRVQLELNKQKHIVGKCTCPVQSNWGNLPCKHEVCALLTIVELLKNNHKSDREKALHEQLINASSQEIAEQSQKPILKASDFSVHVYRNHILENLDFSCHFPVSIRVHYQSKDALDGSIEIPKQLKPFHNYLDAKVFLHTLKTCIDTYPFFLHHGKSTYQITSKDVFICQPELIIDLVDDKQIVMKPAIQSQESFKSLLLIGPGILFNPDQGQFGFFTGEVDITTTPWQYPWIALRDELKKKNTVTEFIKLSDSLQCAFPVKSLKHKPLISAGLNGPLLSDFSLKIKGKSAPSHPFNLQTSVMIKKLSQSGMVSAELKISPDILDAQENLHSITHLVQNVIDALPSKRKEVRVFTYNALVDILNAQTDQEKNRIIETVVDQCKEVLYRLNKVQKAKLTQALEGFKNSNNQALIQSIFIVDGQFSHYQLFLKDTAPLFSACVKSGIVNFEENSSFTNMVIAQADLLKNLSLFKAELDKNGVQLFYEGKLIQRVKLDFDIIIKKNNDIDWFEVKPEILYQGTQLPVEKWEKILEEMGVYHNEQTIQLIDDESLKMLRRMLSYVNPKKKTQKKDATDFFPIPRLQIFDLFQMKQMGAKLKLPQEEEALLNRLLTITSLPEYELPKTFLGKLRDYQKMGYNWLAFLYQHRFGACLADDMGLGKTIQAIAFLAGIDAKKISSPFKKSGPHLIVVPPSLLFNWHHEISLFYPSCKLHIHHGASRAFTFKNADVILTTYDMIRADAKEFAESKFHTIIFDEAQAIKNIYAKRTNAVRQLNGLFKICLTGTPLENHVGEYYSIMDLALPGLFPSYKEFQSQTKHDVGQFLLKRSKPFILRRTKDDILKDLPPKIESNVYLEMQPSQKSLYARTVAQIKNLVLDAYESKTASQAGIIALTALLRLRQICITGELINKEIEEPSPKIAYLIEKIKELNTEGHAALVFSQFTSALDVLEKYFVQEGIEFARLDGATPVAQRQKVIKRFQVHQEIPVMLLSLKAGGVGLNLTRASYVFHLDPWWNPAVENQASDRAHRIGQQQQVIVTRLVMHDTIEEKMMVLKQRKAKLFENIMSISHIDSDKRAPIISREDFEFLLG